MRTIKRFVYNIIRPFLVKDVCRNEDYICINCGRAVLKRQFFCDKDCSDYYNHNTGEPKNESCDNKSEF
mgnify:CR=1 FL=1